MPRRPLLYPVRFQPYVTRRTLGLLLLVLLGCNHPEPFSSRYLPEREPRVPDLPSPVRITVSPGEDQFPSWTADGRSILYSYVDPVSGDRCLGRLPAGGGQADLTRCPTSDPGNDSLTLAVEPAGRGDQLVAWVELNGGRQQQIHAGGKLWLGQLDAQQPTRELWHFPYLSPVGTIHMSASYLRWFAGERLLYVGTDLMIRSPCFACKPDTIPIGREIMSLDAATPDATPVPIGGTSEATSIWPTADSSGFYYTLAGDTRVWRRGLENGPAELVYDFGDAGIVRDVSVVGNRLAAVVGGKVWYGFEESIGFRQVDSGGGVMVVDMVTGAQAYSQVQMFRRSVLSPDGRSLVVEGLDPPLTHPDLWLFTLPAP